MKALQEGQNPLETLLDHGGYSAIFRKIAVIGDSLSSGEFESFQNGKKSYHDLFEFSWGSFISYTTGAQVYHFSKGGMTVRHFLDGWAEERGFFDPEKACQAYIVALGVNDLFGEKQEVGTVGDIDLSDPDHHKATFAGYYGSLLQRYRAIQPKGKFFLVTMPRSGYAEEDAVAAAHAKLLYDFADLFDNTYVIDLNRYAPVYDTAFREQYYLGNHLNPMGYVLTAKMMMTYLDFLVRNDPDAFRQVALIGTPYYMDDAEVVRSITIDAFRKKTEKKN